MSALPLCIKDVALVEPAECVEEVVALAAYDATTEDARFCDASTEDARVVALVR